MSVLQPYEDFLFPTNMPVFVAVLERLSQACCALAGLCSRVTSSCPPFSFAIVEHELTGQEFLISRHYALVIRFGLRIDPANPNFVCVERKEK